MGLDIYLRKVSGGLSLEEIARIEDDYENRAEDNWKEVGGYEAATEEQRAAVNAKNTALAEEMGLDEWGCHPARETVEVPASKVDPDHMFNLNQLRSSYNGGGINNVLRNAGVAGLYEIFGYPKDKQPYHWRPDWAACIERLDDAIEAYGAHISGPGGNVRVMEVRHNMFVAPGQMPSTEAAALEIYRREAAKESGPGWRAYSNRDGEFYLDGLTVRALIPGMTRGILSGQPEPVVYAVIDARVEEGKEDWYLTALKITREMIQFVLGQPDRDAYYLTWSA